MMGRDRRYDLSQVPPTSAIAQRKMIGGPSSASAMTSSREQSDTRPDSVGVTRRKALSWIGGGVGLLGFSAAAVAAETGTSVATPVGTPVADGSPAASPLASPIATTSVHVALPEYATLSETLDALANGDLSSSELLTRAMNRIATFDRGEWGLRAVIELNPDATRIATALDNERQRGVVRGLLHGVPILLKDTYATADKMRTTAGSLALEQNDVVRDAFVVSRLRAAGALILGKTNMTEWSNFKDSGGASGWSARGGQTLNPYRLTHSPWGSSSGSAAAVAAGYVTAALGVETDGSILCPAAACGVVGFKPTVGLLSRAGVIPISHSQDAPGIITRNVTDVAQIASVIAGYDADDPAIVLGITTTPARHHGVKIQPPGSFDFATALDPDGLRGARIGICRSLFGIDPAADAVVENAIPLIEEAGAILIDDVYLDTYGELGSNGYEGAVLLAEFAAGITRFLDTYMPDGPVRTLADIVRFNKKNAERELVWSEQSTLEAALAAESLDSPEYLGKLAINHALSRDFGIDATMSALKLDAMIAPTAPVATPIDPWGDDFAGAATMVPAVAGYPAITVPVGYVDELPVGLMLFGRAFSEVTLLRLAFGFEQQFKPARHPEFLRT